ncbi:MAG: hypothetical protein ABEJ43_10500 [Haloferacaceae archaeon]
MSDLVTGRRVPRVVHATAGLLRRSVGRRDGQAAALVALLGYPVVYWVALGHLSLGGTGGLDVFVVSDPLARMVEARSPYSYEPIARVAAGPVVWLVSPLNVALGLLLGALVAANAAVGVVSYRAPRVCGASARTGPLAGVFALLGGATCCGPAVFFLLGIQATGALVGAFSVLVPLSVALLVGTLLLAGRATPTVNPRK